MLVLGLTFYGFDGDGRAIKEIEIQKGQVERWNKQLYSMEDEFIDVSLKVEEDPRPISKTDPGELKILYKTEEKERSRGYEEDKVSINKELLFGIQA